MPSSKRMKGETHDEWWNRTGKTEWNETWKRIRQRGDLCGCTYAVPTKCSQGKCDEWPYVKLCDECKQCKCGRCAN
tara:strand:- start:14129 stop:14356 length:228 start_codon:yes stop_codon:yes gene_type:complete